MAASSPAASNNGTFTSALFSAVAAANSSNNLRGLNKPKCFKCGNVARSRCPYQSCKSCCSKAQNPCHIHGNATFPDKIPSSSTPLSNQQSAEASLSGNLHRSTSLRKLPNNFAQFNNLQGPLRSRKPLTRKDAAVINEWRFLKLKQYREQNIEVENEAFDRYMQNVELLEEVLAVNSIVDQPMDEGSHISGHNPGSVSGLKLKLRSNSTRTENLSQRLQDVVNQGLGKLRKIDLNNGGNECKKDELARKQEKEKSWRAERVSVLSNLLDKLNKGQIENDLRPCLEIKSHLFKGHERTRRMESEAIEVPRQETTDDGISSGLQSDYSPPKWFCAAHIDQDALSLIDAHFPLIGEIEAL